MIEHGKSGRILGFIEYSYCPGFFWFRIFGHGFNIKDINKRPLLFSERYGYSKYLKVGKYRSRYLIKQVIFKPEMEKEKTIIIK